MGTKRKPNRKAKGAGTTRCGKSLDVLLLAVGRSDLAMGLRSRYAGQIAVAAILLCKSQLEVAADRLGRIVADAIERIESRPTEPPRPRPAS